MEHTIPRDDQPPPDVKTWQLWFSLAAGTAVWIVYLIVVYALTSLTCEWGWFPFNIDGLSGLQVVQITITLAAGAVTIAAGFFAFRNQQHFVGESPIESNRHRFMASMGLALNILYTASIAVSLIPILAFPVCAV